MSGPQQPGDSGSAPPIAGGDSVNLPRRNATGGEPGHSGSRGPSPNNCGPFNNRVYTSYNQRHSPYPRSNYANREYSDNHNSNQKRQERDYTKRTDFQERNPRYPNGSYSGRYKDHHNRDHYHRYQPRRSKDNSSKSPHNNEDSEDSSHLSGVTSDINKNKETNCEPKSDAFKADQKEDNSTDKHHRQTEEFDFELVYGKGKAIEQRTVASIKKNTVTSKRDQATEVNGLNESSLHTKPNSETLKDSEVNQTTLKTPSEDKEPNQTQEEQPTVSRCLKEELNLFKSSEKPSEAEPSQSFPRIQVRPLTQLLKQEILAVTQENRLSNIPFLSPQPSASSASPSRQAFKPALKSRRRTVSNCNYIAGSSSTSQAAGNEAIINNRIASMDKESLKYIINNSDTIYDEHLKFQARRRLRDEIRRQLKNIELDQPKDNPVKELIEDEIVDAIKLPALLLQEIEKCFGIDVSEGQKANPSELDKPDTTKSKNNGKNQSPVKDSKGSEKEICTSSDVTRPEVLSESGTGSTEITTKGKKTKKTIKDSKQCIKGKNGKNKEPESKIERKESSDQNIEAEELSTNSKSFSKDGNDNRNHTIKSMKSMKEILQENNKKKSPKKKFKGSITESGQNKTNIRTKVSQYSLEQEAQTEEPSDSMKRSKDLMARLKAADEVKPKEELRLTKNRAPLLPTPTCGRITNSLKNPNFQCEESKPSKSPTKSSKNMSAKSSKKANQSVVDTSETVIPFIKTEIKRELCGSPITVNPLPSKEVIELLSSSDEEEDMDFDETEEEIVAQNKEQVSEAILKPDPTMDDVASDHSNSSQCSSESTKRRRKLKLQNDAENVVDSFEKLILPHLREALTDRYRRQHSGSLQSRLHFISCVVTSAEHNSQSFSKIEVAKMQMNLKAADNRQSIEFLLREIVNVVNLQKQRRREQEEEQKLANELSPKKIESPVKKNSPPVRRDSLVLDSLQSSTASPARQRSPGLPSRQITHSSPARQSVQPVAARETPTPPLEISPAVVKPQNPEPFPVGLPFLAHLSPGAYARLGGVTDKAEPLGQLGDMVAQNLVDIDRRLLENQNRRSILEEMIMKFQKEKSDLEMLSLELQSRKFLLINSMISRSQTSSVPVVNPRNSPPPSVTAQESTQEENAGKGGIARRTRSRLRRAVVVKLIPKRQVRVQKRVLRKHKSDELISQLRQEIADQEESNKASKDPFKEKECGLSIQSNIKEEPLDESIYDQMSESTPTAKVTQSRPNKPKVCVSANPTHQPLAIIPPLPPPPPPPEPICHMAEKMSGSFPTELLSESQNWTELNCQEKSSVGFIPMGKLYKVLSPITQIKIYREYVIAAAEDGDIYMFHLVSHKLERKITKHSEAITNMSLCEKESILYTTSLDGFFKKSSLENLERVIETVYFKEPLQSIDICWGLAFIGSRWGLISTFNVVTNKVIDKPLVSTGQSIIAIKATKEGVRKILVLGCKGNFVQMHDAGNGLLLRRVCIPEGLNVYSLLLNDGHIYCGTQKNEIYQLEFVTGNLINKLSCGNGAVSIVAYKKRYLLTGCYDGFIYVLDKVTGTQVGRFEGAGRLVLALAVAGDKIVTSSKDNSLEILEVPAAMVNGH
ncbi:uncharacterized protein LOC128266809 isoform X2 [Drosophila gunungcola]|uniref:uncharacterized protein LOC128266809 isoform X2 n=1 Tax=Drosophila gunungcola TaxID=103775 RepID=UPI0022E0FEF4|nr:uncharacterized protein LOC128266809 isoform X2 [Drosophila gunungcola]